MSVKKTSQTNETKGELVKIPSPKIDLRNAHAIRREMASVYRDARSGHIEAQEGTRFCYMLTQIQKAYETAVLEQRLNEIEQTLNNRG